MALDFIFHFQYKIYDLLKSSDKLNGEVKDIHIAIAQDGKYPAVVVNFLKITEIQNQLARICQIDFLIDIFSRDKNKKSLMMIAEIIGDVINIKDASSDLYTILGLKQNDLTFDNAKDLIHHRLTINYKAMLRRKVR